MSDWRKSKKTMGGFKCIEHKVNSAMKGEVADHELCLVGKYGEIWIKNSTTYRCLIKHLPAQKKALKLLKSVTQTTKRGEELLLNFPSNLLSEMVTILKVPKSSGKQLTYMEE